MFELTYEEIDTTRYALQIFLDSFVNPDTIANHAKDIEIATELQSRMADYLASYCKHGTYVGGVMEDFMCGYCEQGDE